MAWTFKDIGSDDLHGLPVVSPRENHVLRRHFWGLEGETEVRSDSGKRMISFEVMVGTDDQMYSLNDILIELELYDSTIGEHGDLEIFTQPDQSDVLTFNECTLDSIERIMPVPKFDLVGVLPLTGYFQMIKLVFCQLTPSGTLYQ